MKTLLIAGLAALTLSATATAGNPSLCAKDGWQTAQASNGAAFSSLPECARARDVFKPTLTISPGHVVAGERFTLTAGGMHPDASVTILFALAGQEPYGSVTPPTSTLADGSYSLPLVYAECAKTETGQDVTVDLTITLVDSFGVHASAPLVLC